MSDKFLSIRDVMSCTSLKRSTLYERVKARTFPKQISLGGRRIAWLESEVDAWMAARIDPAHPDKAC